MTLKLRAKSGELKQIPETKSVRDDILRAAPSVASEMDSLRLPTTDELEAASHALLARLGLPQAYLGFAMVAVSNSFWVDRFAATPFARRLLLLPRCLRHSERCHAPSDADGLHCRRCGACEIGAMEFEAQAMGYEVIVAEGAGSATMKVLHGDADAVLGVACLDSLERSYSRIAEMGIPHMAIPLLRDGCVDTEVEIDRLLALLHSASTAHIERPRSYLPLLRDAVRTFDPDRLRELLASSAPGGDETDPRTATEAIAFDWLSLKGKRLRPFLTLAAYAAAAHGDRALSHGYRAEDEIPPAIRRLAIAIEAMHKASLIHDDIEDDDEYRYGRRTVHRAHGIPAAVNVGDYLVGLGYRLVAGEAASLGPQCVADILGRLAEAHLGLCEGQGTELMWPRTTDIELKPIDALGIYAKKTAPAIEVALYAGPRAAGMEVDQDLLRRYCVFLGEGYQIRNDLDDWEPDDSGRLAAGGDALAGRPTILRALALKASRERGVTIDWAGSAESLRATYEELGVFDETYALLERLRERASEAAASFEPAPLRDLLSFLVGLVLPARLD